MVEAMALGSVIVDLASERGGNCELTRMGEKVVEHGVSIIGTINLASTVPYHASQMYAKNLTNFLLNMVKDGKLNLNMDDEIVRSTLVTEGGEIVNPARTRIFLAACIGGANKREPRGTENLLSRQEAHSHRPRRTPRRRSKN